MEARISCAVVPMSHERPRMKVPALQSLVASARGDLESRCKGSYAPGDHRLEGRVEQAEHDQDGNDPPNRDQNVVETADGRINVAHTATQRDAFAVDVEARHLDLVESRVTVAVAVKNGESLRGMRRSAQSTERRGL